MIWNKEPMFQANIMLKFLYNWRAAIIVFPALFLYCGFIPLLKACGAVKISWMWALCPIWAPFVAFWTIVGFIALTTVVCELGFLIFPDKNPMDYSH